MNHIYRTVWNEVSRAFVAVAEIVRGRGRGGRSRKSASVVAGDDTSRGAMGTRSAAGASRRQGLSPAAPRPMALEQRFMFDGAAVADAAATLADHPAWAEPATEVPDAPTATPAEVRSVAFIDATLPEAQALAAGMAPGIQVVMLAGGRPVAADERCAGSAIRDRVGASGQPRQRAGPGHRRPRL
jgi:hypothetical protein